MRTIVIAAALCALATVGASAQELKTNLPKKPGSPCSEFRVDRLVPVQCLQPVPDPEPHRVAFHAAMAAAGGVQFGEKLVTTYLLAKGRSEANPILAPFASKPALFGVVTGAMLTASTIAVMRYHQSPNRTLRWVARAIVAEELALGTIALVHNSQLIQEGR